MPPPGPQGGPGSSRKPRPAGGSWGPAECSPPVLASTRLAAPPVPSRQTPSSTSTSRAPRRGRSPVRPARGAPRP
eukprot:11158553-Lingulodinium_polyedra.AAC.1